MSVEVKIPAVGESITSGIVSVWHKKSGDFVNAGDALFTLETDKVSTEISAETSGVLDTIVNEGQEVKIGEVVATIDDSKKAPEAKPQEKKKEKAEAPSPQSSPSGRGGSEAKPKEKSTDGEPTAGAASLSPAVRRIVEEEHLEPEKISGTGPGGRLTKADALAAANKKSVGDAVSVSEKPTASATGAEDRQSTDGRIVRIGDGAADRRDSDDVQRMRHECRSGFAREISGCVHEKAWRKAGIHVVLHQSIRRSAENSPSGERSNRR